MNATARWPLWLHSMATPETDAAGCLGVAHRLGLDGVELIVADGYPAALPAGAGTAEAAAVARVADGLGLRVGALCSYARDLDDESAATRRATADALRRAVDLAVAAGAGHVRVLAGRDRPPPDRPAAVRRAAATLHDVAGHADQAGVSLNVENHMDTLATSAAATRELVDAAAAPAVGVLYDQANLAIMGAEPAAVAVGLQRELIRHVHVKNFVRSGGFEGRTPVGLAGGEVDWPATLRLLDGYTGALTLEYERRWYPDVLPPAAVGLAADLELLRSLS
ncbi:sugar phosphate isomerase/epimerase family protein [Jiangella alkaliphila]|uniref:Sugar phosphate isomerase/epimerase n=1 Tax=Jiangella alkaliphila TaxID=419479 RepID=A0A1H2J6J8_9ACTN|nr:sugar phosphate isomerase/epimerase family protein [Jiangella alkaliphila]SDU52074.1 Sugar phosphate isomerase/epimerase [Jiangella alkaliphila]